MKKNKKRYIGVLIILIIIVVLINISAVYLYNYFKNKQEQPAPENKASETSSSSKETCCRECVISLTSKPETSRSKPCFVFVNDATLRYKLSDPCSGYFKDNSKITIKECMDY